MNVCSYHLQEAGATPVQELAFALATAIAVLDTVKASGEVDAGGVRRGRRAHLVLRQRRHALHHRDVQDARVRRTVGRDHARPLRRHRSEAAAVPLRRAGQFARADRAAAGKQRLPHPDRDAGGDAVEERARARRAAAGLERGARPAAPVRPAMVAAHAADPGLRDRPARIRRHLRRLARRSPPRSRSSSARRATSSPASTQMGGAVAAVEIGLHEGAAGRIEHAPAGSDRARRADRGRRQHVHRDRSRRRSRPARARSSPCRTSVEARADRAARTRGARRATPKAVARGAARLRAAARDGRNIMPPSIAAAKAGVTTGEWGDGAARGVRRIPRADRRRPRGAQRHAAASTTCAPTSSACRASSAGASSSWSASPASTAIPTAPSRSPCARATPAWTSSTKASA